MTCDVKTGRPNGAAVRTLRDAMPDVEAVRGWFVDHGSGIEPLAPAIARAGFGDVQSGLP